MCAHQYARLTRESQYILFIILFLRVTAVSSDIIPYNEENKALDNKSKHKGFQRAYWEIENTPYMELPNNGRG